MPQPVPTKGDAFVDPLLGKVIVVLDTSSSEIHYTEVSTLRVTCTEETLTLEQFTNYYSAHNYYPITKG